MQLIRAILNRLGMGGGDSPPTTRYVCEGDLPLDPAELVEAGTIKPWRTSADGQAWFRVSGGPIDGNDGGTTDA